ncbi:hypothetical protein NDU88_000777 [Pleurodeles waltl]|uniref:Uncharacterized protein n=1 Tax=Pleurodeles waltl TaxID=8319 RepID=A0AAV7US33_PLEWA|nr:hypothetical protein NDU88_000777 [Pleurodeles waltl]
METKGGVTRSRDSKDFFEEKQLVTLRPNTRWRAIAEHAYLQRQMPSNRCLQGGSQEGNWLTPHPHYNKRRLTKAKLTRDQAAVEQAKAVLEASQSGGNSFALLQTDQPLDSDSGTSGSSQTS